MAEVTSTPDRIPSTNSFVDGSISKHLLRLGSYMAMGSISLNVAQLAEAVYLGIVGTEALAAMGFAFPITITLFAFAGGIGSGASSVIARSVGAGDQERTIRLVTHAQVLAIVVGITLAVLGYQFANDIVTLLGAKDMVRTMSIDYLQVYMIGIPLFLLSIVGSTLLRATGSAASPGIIMTAGSVLQIILGPVLIFGWFGIAEMGIAGAAWAYVISRFVSVCLYCAMLVRARMVQWSFDQMRASWLAILHVGGPAIASGLIQPVSMLIVTRLLAGHGHEVVAGYNVASRVETMAHMILWSASSSAEPLIGQNWGARKFERVKEALRQVNRFCLAWGAFTFIFMVTFGEWLVSLIDDNQIVVDVAGAFFLVIPLTIGFMGIMQVANSSFNARGRPTPAFVLSLVRTLVFYIPLAILGDWLWGYLGIFIATAFTNVSLGIVAWYCGRVPVQRESRLLTSTA
jgi:putative MATE family efflux protein